MLTTRTKSTEVQNTRCILYILHTIPMRICRNFPTPCRVLSVLPPSQASYTNRHCFGHSYVDVADDHLVMFEAALCRVEKADRG